MRKNRVLILALALVLLFGVSVGGTLAWLLDDTDPVVNTFTDSDINITLTETNADDDTDANNNEYQMIPGWTIDKNPKVTVKADSEDCWLFVKITESTDPDLDDYISYAIATGWTAVDDGDSNDDTIVIGRKVYKDDTTKEFGIIGYTDTKGTDDTSDDVFVADKVLVKDDVTKTMMDDIDGVDAQGAAATTEKEPTLTFKAYAVQLFKTNSDGDKTNTADEFDMATAWAKAAAMG